MKQKLKLDSNKKIDKNTDTETPYKDYNCSGTVKKHQKTRLILVIFLYLGRFRWTIDIQWNSSWIDVFWSHCWM